MASGFQEALDCDGFISRVRANFGRSKEFCMNTFNGKTYCHISDKSKCFAGGKFDISKSKSVTLTFQEALELKRLIEEGRAYDTTFHHFGSSSSPAHPLGTSGHCSATPHQATQFPSTSLDLGQQTETSTLLGPCGPQQTASNHLIAVPLVNEQMILPKKRKPGEYHTQHNFSS